MIEYFRIFSPPQLCFISLILSMRNQNQNDRQQTKQEVKEIDITDLSLIKFANIFLSTTI